VQVDLDPVKVDDGVTFEYPFLEIELVNQARATAGLHRNEVNTAIREFHSQITTADTLRFPIKTKNPRG